MTRLILCFALTVCPRVIGASDSPAASTRFILTSSAFTEGSAIPREFTGDGAGVNPPLEWKGVPQGTKSFAVIMHHFPHEGESARWYWVLYHIPATITKLPKAVKGIGVNGNNCVGPDLVYAPPHSKGPGVKKYTITIYALSSLPKITLAPEKVSRDVLLSAIKDITLAKAELNFTYDRTDLVSHEKGKDAPMAKPEPPPKPESIPFE
jgi:phosphatidylethanolamine-binding protein (PEBP) family uncharacterized protein